MFQSYFRPIPLPEILQQENTKLADNSMASPLGNPLNSVPKTSIDLLLNSLTETPSKVIQSSLERTTESPPNRAEASVVKDMSQHDYFDKGQKQDSVFIGFPHFNNSLPPVDRTISYTEKMYANVTAIPVLSEERSTEVTLANSGFETLTLGSVLETSSTGHVTLQSFLEAISQKRVEDVKVDRQDPVTEGGPFLLPFRTTLRTTTISTTSTTTLETTTTGKL